MTKDEKLYKQVLLSIQKEINKHRGKHRGGASTRASARASARASTRASARAASLKSASHTSLTASLKSASHTSLTASAPPRSNLRKYAALVTFAGFLLIVLNTGGPGPAIALLLKFPGILLNFASESPIFYPIDQAIQLLFFCIKQSPGLIGHAFSYLYKQVQYMVFSYYGQTYIYMYGLPMMIKLVSGIYSDEPGVGPHGPGVGPHGPGVGPHGPGVGPDGTHVKLDKMNDKMETMLEELKILKTKLETEMENAVYDPDSNLSKKEQLKRELKRTIMEAEKSNN